MRSRVTTWLLLAILALGLGLTPVWIAILTWCLYRLSLWVLS